MADEYNAGDADVKSMLVATEVAHGNRDHCFVDTLPAHGAALGAQLGGIKRKETRVFRRRGGFCIRSDR